MGIIFDMDGVLIDSEELHFKAYTQVLARLGANVSREEYAREWIAAGRGPEYAVKAYSLPLSPEELRALKGPVYHEILKAEACLMPGVIEALSRLRPRYPLALATNSNRADVGFVMERFQLQRFFKAVVTRECYALAKPEPDAFLAAAAALELPPSSCLVVEDSQRGIVAAHRAGAKCVAVPHAFTRDSDFSLAERVIADLDELTVELVEELLGDAEGDLKENQKSKIKRQKEL